MRPRYKELAQVLGVRYGEEFKLRLPSGIYTKCLVTEDGFFYWNGKRWENSIAYVDYFNGTVDVVTGIIKGDVK